MLYLEFLKVWVKTCRAYRMHLVNLVAEEESYQKMMHTKQRLVMKSLMNT